MDEIDIIDELSAPTTERIATPIKEIEQPKINLNNDDFSPSDPPTEEIHEEVAPALPTESEKPKKSPKESAESIMGMLDLAITSTVMPIMAKKLKKKFGAELFEKAQMAMVTEITNPDKLTNAEKNLIQKYKQFEVVLDKIKSDIPFSTIEKDQLLPPTIRLCEKNGIEVSENVAFGVHLLQVVSSRVIDVVML